MSTHLDDDTTTSNTEDSLDKLPSTLTPASVNTPIVSNEEETNDSVASFDNNLSFSLKRQLGSDYADCGDSVDADDISSRKKFKDNNGNDEDNSAASSNVSK